MTSSVAERTDASDDDNASTLSHDTDYGQESVKPTVRELKDDLYGAKRLWDDKLDQLLGRIEGVDEVTKRLEKLERTNKRTANRSESSEPDAWPSKTTRVLISPPIDDSSDEEDSSYEYASVTSSDEYCTDAPGSSDDEEEAGDELMVVPKEADPALLALNGVKETYGKLLERAERRQRLGGEKVDKLWYTLREDIVRCGRRIREQKASRIQELEKENTRMKEGIKKVISERPELAGDLFGDPIVPLDVMLLIGKFLLGHNAYASLAKFSLTCHALRQELQPMLYETVILNEDNPDRNKVFSSGSSLRSALAETKYFIGGEDFFNLPTGGLDLFPNLQVGINMGPYHGAIILRKSITIKTFTALMHIPHFSRSKDGTRVQGCGTVLPTVTIEDGVWVLGNQATDNASYVLPKLNPDVSSISGTSYILNHTRATPNLRRTLSSLFRLMLSSDGLRTNPVGRHVAPEWEFRPQGSICVADLITEVIEEPISNGFYPAVDIINNNERQLKLAALQETMNKAAAMYHRLFQLASKSVAGTHFTETGPFYRIEHEREAGGIFVGELRRTKEHEGFCMRIVLFNGGTREPVQEETFRLESPDTGKGA
ncbi:hypothetical protein QFC21_006070 [Naganishia friedmannii]|uniref:Uncharacterized protein n=1 Tax=Naganishia friedmannii TaxID=89922 RepID=A0ACC2V5H6_9TREE|nr:hypothetical protein QFC21_006070 [Naganishia friedmannii]